jgi:glutamate-ammonia-ligase adenylyltransferase
MMNEIRPMRLRMQNAASPSNLKRGEGGTVDVDWVAQVLLLKHVAGNPSLIRHGTIDLLLNLESAGHLSHEDASTLVRGYRILRRTEANLRLMDAEGRYELPDDERQMKNLAFLMGQPNAASVRQMCDAARKSNRAIFDRVVG